MNAQLREDYQDGFALDDLPFEGRGQTDDVPGCFGRTCEHAPDQRRNPFDELEKLVDAEGPHLADPDWMGMLAGLGIVKGEP